jgi:hypothetical protein
LEKNMNDQNITVKLSLVQGILGYLGRRPYEEVFQIIQALQEQVAPQVAPAAPAETPE